MDRWFFDPLRLGSYEAMQPQRELEPGRLTIGRQVALYVTVVLGILASGFLESYQLGQQWFVNWVSVGFALVVGVVLLPGAVDRQKLNGHKEELVQFAVVFTYGMGWQALFSAAIRAATG